MAIVRSTPLFVLGIGGSRPPGNRMPTNDAQILPEILRINFSEAEIVATEGETILRTANTQGSDYVVSSDKRRKLNPFDVHNIENVDEQIVGDGEKMPSRPQVPRHRIVDSTAHTEEAA